jgi:hypothetical protein
VLMLFSAPDAAELQQPAVAAAFGDTQDARVFRDFDLGYSVLSHCRAPESLGLGFAVQGPGDSLYLGCFVRGITEFHAGAFRDSGEELVGIH